MSGPEILVKTDAQSSLAGRVVDACGLPIRDASVMGGFDSELAMNHSSQTVTDGNGQFNFDSALEPGTPFYVIAPRHALVMTTLLPDELNTIVLNPPVTLGEDNKIPAKVYMIMAAPSGGRRLYH